MNAIDTNVWLYSHDKRDPRKESAARQLIATTRRIALPWQVGCEFMKYPFTPQPAEVTAVSLPYGPLGRRW